MIKKIILTVFIFFGIFLLVDVNYKLHHAGMGIIENYWPAKITAPTTVNVGPSSLQDSSASQTSSALPANDSHTSCATQGYALNSTFSDEIKARLPVWLLRTLSPDRNSIAYFSEIIGLKSNTIEFKWFKGDILLRSEIVNVPSARWRVWSVLTGLNNINSGEIASEPIRVELWAADCLIHADKIMLATDEKVVRLNNATDFFKGQSTLMSDIFNSFHYSTQSADPSPVYIFKVQNAGAGQKINIDIENVVRDEKARDVFSSAVYHDDELPLSVKKNGGIVVNYSDAIINRKTLGGDTVLLEAIKNKSYNTIKSLLLIGANPFVRDADGRSPLDLALANKDKALVEMLMEHMLHGSSVERSGWSFSKNSDLLREGRYFSVRNRLGETALMRAAASGDEFAIMSLIGLNADQQNSEYLPYRSPYDFDYAGRQAVDIAIESGFLGAALLLENAMEKFSPSWTVYQMRIASELQESIPVNCFVQPGKRLWLSMTLLDVPLKNAKVIWSARKNSDDQWKILKTEEFRVSNREYKLLSHIDPADIGTGEGWRIKVDFYLNDLLVSNALLEENYSSGSGSDCDSDTHEEISLQQQFAAWMPLKIVSKRASGVSAEKLRIHYGLLADAIKYENIYAVQYLLEQGMSPQIRYGSRNSLLQESVLENKLALTKYLLTQGLDLVQSDAVLRKKQRSLVNSAIHERDDAMVRFLVQQGLPVNEADNWVKQPLVEALDNCDADMVALLLDLGADLERIVKSKSFPEGMPVRTYARRCDYEPRVLEVINAFETHTAAND